MCFKVKQFVYSADGKSMASCADKIAVNEESKRFAVADGVSASYMPEIWAEILTTSFVSCNRQADEFPRKLEDDLLTSMSKEWQVSVHNLEQQADSVLARRYERNRRLFGQAASTLAGVSFENNILHYYVLGDSCIFFVKESGFSVYSNVKDEKSFNNTPNYLSSSKYIKGEALVGQVELSQGWVLLMTDAISEWFWNQQKKDNTIVQYLWNIESQKDFKEFIDIERDKLAMNNDDVALLMIMIIEDNSATINIPNSTIEVLDTDIGEFVTNKAEPYYSDETSCENMTEHTDNSENPYSGSELAREDTNAKDNQSVKEADERFLSNFHLFMGLYRKFPKLFKFIISIYRFQKPAKKRNNGHI